MDSDLKVISGIFMGYDQRAGGSWSGDLLIADWHAIATAKRAGEVHIQTIRAKEVFPTHMDTPSRFRFPLVTGEQIGRAHV